MPRTKSQGTAKHAPSTTDPKRPACGGKGLAPKFAPDTYHITCRRCLKAVGAGYWTNH